MDSGGIMSTNESDSGTTVALYWDFENLHASLCEEHFGEGAYDKADSRFKPQEPLIDVQAVVELASSFGPIAINRAYCNWQFFGRYRDALLQAAVELIQLFPPGGSAKNGADIKLCLDATEDMPVPAHWHRRRRWRRQRLHAGRPHGYPNFPAMVQALEDVVEVKKGDSDQIVRLRA